MPAHCRRRKRRRSLKPARKRSWKRVIATLELSRHALVRPSGRRSVKRAQRKVQEVHERIAADVQKRQEEAAEATRL